MIVLRAGQLVGQRYTILERIAVGGMGAVYRARHNVSRREVALKVLHSERIISPETVERFRREASASVQIGHPGIVEVLDAGVDANDGSLFLAMELLHGEHLGRRLAREGTTLADALHLIDQLLSPLAAAHARGFVHRDLKPENVFVVPLPDGSGEEVKLLDFGVAKHLEGENATLTGSALGTPHYMAPEQVLSSKEATPASDVWAIGIMLYELVTGRRPFDGHAPQAVLVKTCTDSPAPVSSVAPRLGRELAELIDSCLARDPSERPSDASVLRAALHKAVVATGPFEDCAITVQRYASSAPASLPSSVDLTTAGTAPRVGWRRIEGGRWSFEVPPDWEPRTTMVPNVGVSLQAPEVLEGFRPRALLKVEAFDGDTASYGEMGLRRLGEVARVLRFHDAQLAGVACIEGEAIFESADPPFRGLRRGVVIDGRGYMLACDGPVLRFIDVVPIFRAIYASFRVEER